MVTKTPYAVTGGGLAYRIAGKPHGLFLDLLFTLLSKAGTVSPVLRCPECENLFYRIRKQKYCSRPCVAKANWRAYMRTDDGKKAKQRADKKRSKQVADEKRAKKKRATRPDVKG